jgi:hypothetical protein
MAGSTSSIPTAHGLSQAAGISLPTAFVRLILLAISRRGRRGYQHLTDRSLGILLAGPWQAAISGKSPAAHDIRYPQTPPELVPFATQRVDGVHYGFIARTPELPANDYAMGEFCPMDPDPVVFLATTFSKAIENLASQQLSYLRDDDEELSESAAADLARISKLLKIAPSIRKAGRQFTRDGDARPIPLAKPRGYLFHKTLDGIGVLAPKAAFARAALGHDTDDLASGIKRSIKLLAADCPASALVILKDLWWARCHDPTAIARVAPPFADAYRALNRPAFAEIVNDKARRVKAR